MSNNPRINAAERSIASEKSDPFVRNRVYSHMSRWLSRDNHQGIVSFRDNGQDAFYSAEESTEERFYTLNGVKVFYNVTVYHNIQRP